MNGSSQPAFQLHSQRSQVEDNSDLNLMNLVKTKSASNKKMTLQNVLQNSNRSEAETRFLYKVIKDMPFFAEFKQRYNFEQSEQQVLINLCRGMKYEKYEATDVIFKENQPSDGKFYILLKGIAYVVQNEESSKNFFEEQNKQRLTDKTSLEKKSLFIDVNSSISRPDSTNSNNNSQRSESKRSSFLGAIPLSRTNQRADSPKLSPMTPRRGSLRLTVETQNEPSDANKVFDSLKLSTLLQKRGFQVSKFGQTGETNDYDMSINSQNSIHDESPKIVLASPLLQKHINGGSLMKMTNKVIQINRVHAAFSKNKKSTKDSLQARIEEYGIYRDKIEEGGAFGHAALQQGYVKRNATVIAATVVELLVIQKEHLKLVREHFYNLRNRAKEFMLKYFPCMDDVNASTTIENLVFLLKEEIYPQNALICQEGTSKDKFFAVLDGECHLMKTFIVDGAANKLFIDADQHLRVPGTNQKLLPLSVLEKGAFIGEETLFNSNKNYEYTVKVISPSATVYSIERSVFIARFPRMTFDSLKSNHIMRQQNYLKIVKSIQKTLYPSTEVIQTHEEEETDEEEELSESRSANQLFQKPIIIIPHYDHLNYNTESKNKLGVDNFDEKAVKNKLVSFSHRIYTSTTRNNPSMKTLPQVANTSPMQKIKARENSQKIALKEANRIKTNRFKLQLQNSYERGEEGSSSVTSDRFKRKTLRNRETDCLQMNEYLERSVKNFYEQKGIVSDESTDPNNIESYRLDFGRKYMISHQLRELQTSKINTEPSNTSRAGPSARVKQVLSSVQKTKERFSKFLVNQSDTSGLLEISQLHCTSIRENISNNLLEGSSSERAKYALPKLKSHFLIASNNNISQSIEAQSELNDYSDLLFITSARTDKNDSSRDYNLSSIEVNAPKRKAYLQTNSHWEENLRVKIFSQRQRALKPLQISNKHSVKMNKASRPMDSQTNNSTKCDNQSMNQASSLESLTVVNSSKNLLKKLLAEA